MSAITEARLSVIINCPEESAHQAIFSDIVTTFEKTHKLAYGNLSDGESFSSRITEICKKHPSSSVDYLILIFHGNKEGLELGKMRFYDSAEKNDFQGLSSDTRIILYSCETGIKGGIAEKISEATGLEVFAPTKPCHGIRFSTDEKGRYTPLFYGAFFQIPTAHYRNDDDLFTLFLNRRITTFRKTWYENRLPQLNQAAQMGHREATYHLANYYRDKEPEKALLLYKAAAKLNHPLSYLELGRIYAREGLSVQQSLKKALHYFTWASALGLSQTAEPEIAKLLRLGTDSSLLQLQGSH